MSKFLQRMMKAQKQEGLITPLVDQYMLLNPEENTRKTGVFHPSEITGEFCSRAWAYGEMHPEMKRMHVSPGLQRTFDVGHALHTIYKIYLGDIGVLFGKWACLKCGHVVEGFKPKEACPNCGVVEPERLGIDDWDKRVWLYQEVTVRDEDFWLYGHTDGIVVLDQGKYVFEFKTANSRMFDQLKNPDQMMQWVREIHEKYQDQTRLYMHGLELDRQARLKEMEADDPLYDVYAMPFRGAVLLYFNKDDQRVDPLEFVVPFDSKVHQLMDRKWMETKPARIWKTEGIMPPRVCETRAEGKKRKCNFVDICFKGDQ